ncbi:MAG: translocation/assembly module TamB domain-containing protein, partial [Flavobacteriales bacterium]
RVAGYLSDQLGAKVEIGGVYVDLWARLEIRALYIEDQKQDTLLFVPNLFVRDYHFDKISGEIYVINATLEDPYFNIIKHQGDTALNYAFIMRYVDNLSTPGDTSPTLLNLSNLKIVDGRLNYTNENKAIRTRFGIDWNHIQANGLNVELDAFAVVGDSIHAGIQSLSLVEKSGFDLKNLTSDFTMTPGHIRMNQSIIETNNSLIQGDLAFQFESIDDFDFFEERVKMNHHLRDTRLYMDDLAYFSDDLVGWDKEVLLSGKFKGKINSLKGKEVKIQLDENTRFAGSFSMDGLPEIDQTFIIMDIDELTTNKTELDRLQIPPFDSLHYLKTPDNFASLGQMTYSGNFTGFINDFASIGKIETAIGDVETDIALRFDEKLQDYIYRGDLATNRFDLGKFYNSSDLGAMSCRVFVDGSSLELKKMNAGFKGDIYSIHLNGYDYTNIKVKDGRFALRQFKGDFSIEDPNVSVDFNGTVDFRPADPLLNFTAYVDHLNLKALGILPQYDYSSISGKVQVTSEGFEFEKFVGEIILEEVTYCASSADYHIGNLVLTSERKGEPSIRMRSNDLADIDIQGDFDANELASSLTNIVSQLVPSLDPPVREHTTQNFKLEMKVYDISQITEVFIPELVIAPYTKLELSVNELNNTFDLFINSGSVTYDGNEFKETIVKADRFENDPTIYLFVGLQKFETKSKDVFFERVSLNLETKVDTVYTSLVWGDSLTSHKGNIDGKLTVNAFDAYDFLFYDMCSVSAKNETWTIKNGTFLSMNKKEVVVRNLELSNGDQWIRAEGGVSEDPRIPLNFEVHEFDIGTINAFTGSTTKFYGIMGGVASVRDLYNNVIFSNDITLRDFMLNDYYVGYLCVETDWDNLKRSLRVDGTLEKDLEANSQVVKLTPLKFSGYYNPDNKESPLDLIATVNDLDLAFINEFLSPGVIDIRGFTSGTIAITGQLESPQMEGEAFLRDASIFISYLNVRYHLEKQIGIYPDMFTFDYLPISDQEKNPGRLTGQIMHRNFADWNFDLVIDMATPMLAMNTTELLNPLYFGKAYTTGVVNIYGYQDQLEFDCNLKSEKGTILSLPIGSTQEQIFENFVHFIDDENPERLPQNDLSGIKLNFNMEITPDAQFQIVFD